MSKEFKELKDVNFSVRPLQTNFAVLDWTRGGILNAPSGLTATSGSTIGAGGPRYIVPSAMPTSVGDLSSELTKIGKVKNDLQLELKGLTGAGLTAGGPAPAGVPGATATVTSRQHQILNEIGELTKLENAYKNNLQLARITSDPTKMAKLGAVQGAFNANVRRLEAAGQVAPAGGWNPRIVAERMQALGITPMRASTGVKPIVPAPAATGNAFDRVVRRIGGAARRHPVLAGITGLAAIGGAVRIAKAREDGRIDPDSYYIMDNNSMSMVPRAFPSRESAMYIRDERYPGAAINKGTTLLQKA